MAKQTAAKGQGEGNRQWAKWTARVLEWEALGMTTVPSVGERRGDY